MLAPILFTQTAIIRRCTLEREQFPVANPPEQSLLDEVLEPMTPNLGNRAGTSPEGVIDLTLKGRK